MNNKINDGTDFVRQFQNYIHTNRLMIASNVPESCKVTPCILGVDEAGRGPVLGPMVYGISYCPINKAEDFGMLGCADSKALTEKKREEIFEVLCACDDFVGWSVDVISPNYISNSMLKRAKRSLNEVAVDSTLALIRKAIDDGVQVAEIYVDTIGPPEKYQEKLSKIFPQCKVTVAKKADAIFPIVSGASICAKVCRDRVISSWKFAEEVTIEGGNFGSGYPNDPETKKFMKEYIDDIFGFPSIVRFSWSTASKVLEASATTVEWEEEIEQPSVQDYFKTGGKQHLMKQNFFINHCLTNIKQF